MYYYNFCGLKLASNKKLFLINEETKDFNLKLNFSLLPKIFKFEKQLMKGEMYQSSIPFINNQILVNIDNEKLYITDSETFLMDYDKSIRYVNIKVIEDDITLFTKILVEVFFPLIFREEKIYPTHCMAFEYNKKIYIGFGDSGYGKSTLSAFLLKNGEKFISDDTIYIKKENDSLLINNGFNYISLWNQSADNIYNISDGINKYGFNANKKMYEVNINKHLCNIWNKVDKILYFERNNDIFDFRELSHYELLIYFIKAQMQSFTMNRDDWEYLLSTLNECSKNISFIKFNLKNGFDEIELNCKNIFDYLERSD